MSFKLLDISDSLNNAFGNTRTGKIITDSVMLGSGAFIITALARAIAQSQSNIADYGGGGFDNDLDTTMKNSLVDKSTQRSLKKKAADDKEPGFWSKFWEGGKEVLDSTADLIVDPEKFFKDRFDKRDLLNYAVPATAAVLASIAGYKAIDSMYDKSDATKLQKQKERLTELHKRLVLSRARNARGDFSDAEYARLQRDIAPVVRTMNKGKTASINKSAADGKPVILPIAGLLMLAAAAAGGIGGYHWASAKNDKRLRYKAIKSGLKGMAQQEALMKNLDQSLTDDPEVEAYLASLVKKDAKAPVNTPVAYTEVTI